MAPRVAKLGHVAYRTPDLEETAWFFEELMGLQATERTDDAVYLRGLRDWEHHTMSLREGGEAGVEHVAWRTHEPEHVEAFGFDPSATESDRSAVIQRWKDWWEEHGDDFIA